MHSAERRRFQPTLKALGLPNGLSALSRASDGHRAKLEADQMYLEKLLVFRCEFVAFFSRPWGRESLWAPRLFILDGDWEYGDQAAVKNHKSCSTLGEYGNAYVLRSIDPSRKCVVRRVKTEVLKNPATRTSRRRFLAASS